MRALTVRQPWAAAIVAYGKDVENRTRNLAGGYRGPVAIHAGKTFDDDADLLDRDDRVVIAPGCTLRDIDRVEEARGAFVGVVDLVALHGPHADPCSRWAAEGQWHLVLANPRPLADPIPARGALGLWTPTGEQLAAIESGLSAVTA